MKTKLSLLTLIIGATLCSSVMAAAPGKPSIKDSWQLKKLSMLKHNPSATSYKQRIIRDPDGLKLNIAWDMWSNDNAKTASVLLNGKSVWEGAGSAKSAPVTITQGGSYQLTVKVCNDDGCTLSDALDMTVVDTDGSGAKALDKPLTDNNKPYKNTSGKVVGTYFTEWSRYGRHFPVDKIPAQNLTHILYGFVPICGNNESLNIEKMQGSYQTLQRSCQGQPDYTVSIHDLHGALDSGEQIGGNFGQLIALKKAHPHLKILPSIGGWTLSDPFFDMHDETKRTTFVNSVKEYLQTWKFFDGVDIDWEFPGGNGANPDVGNARDKQTYTLLMKELRAMLDDLSKKDNRTYELTSAIGAGVQKIAAVDYKAAQEYMDYIFVMNYDFAGHFDLNHLNHQTSLYTNNDIGTVSEHSTEKAIDALLKQQVNPEKLVVGVAEYARAWSGVHDYKPGQPFTGKATGPMIGRALGAEAQGVLLYNEIVNHYSSGDYKKFYDGDAQAAYIFNEKNGDLISYDTAQSVKAKGDFVQKHKLGGLFSWEIGNSNGDLLNAMHEGLGHGEGTVDPVNRAPVAVTRVATQTVNVDEDVTLDGSSSYDPDQDALSYTWKQVSGTPVTLDDAAAEVAHFSAPADAGELKFSLSVSDGELHSKPAMTTVVVKAQSEIENNKPVIDIAGAKQRDVAGGQKVIFDASNTADADGDKLTFRWETPTKGVAYPALEGKNSSVLSFVAPKVAKKTTFTFQLVVSDAKDSVTSEIYTVNVLPEQSDDHSQWSSSKIYHGGDTVTWNGKTYKAKWWTQNNEPGTNDVWDNQDKEIGGEWNMKSIYLGGDEVSYQGKSWVAKWWTKGDKPGSSDVWKAK
ncbi:glycosyl hydrolase family 18 protein [Serratia ficaria]|uniref:glycosyl hydrolase family 18 protein n=1 Tax=Serratia ficaria TaxID=61651 RepID=UPI00217752F3|nr:glycosyl hydrolase family 18 protein [Serratia ficaria]CAI1507366.1 Chitinase A precursor [Serratia ficaria]